VKIEVTPRQLELIEKLLDNKLCQMIAEDKEYYYVGDCIPDYKASEIKELYTKVVKSSL
jgi:hypothetical protein